MIKCGNCGGNIFVLKQFLEHRIDTAYNLVDDMGGGSDINCEGCGEEVTDAKTREAIMKNEGFERM